MQQNFMFIPQKKKLYVSSHLADYDFDTDWPIFSGRALLSVDFFNFFGKMTKIKLKICSSTKFSFCN